MATLTGHGADITRLRDNLQQYKEESARVRRPSVLVQTTWLIISLILLSLGSYGGVLNLVSNLFAVDTRI
jgi:hypothetical protein